MERIKQESGIILAMILVFLLVLSVTMLVASSLGWTDMRVVTTVRDEKIAARIAEAGVAEALKRLSMTAQSSVSVDGDTFDPSFAAATGHTDCSQTTDHCPDVTNPDWAANIHLGTGGTSKSGNVVTTRTIQTNSDRVVYGNTTTGTNPDDGDLTIRWNCTDPLGGWPCTDAASIRRLFNMPVIDVIATGYYPSRSHPNPASRKMTVSVIPGIGSLGTYSTGCPVSGTNGINMVGTVQVSVQGTVIVDSSCDNSNGSYAINGNGGTLVQTGGQMNVVGDVASGHASSPDLNTGAPPKPDPLGPLGANLLQPCFGTLTTGCFDMTTSVNGTAYGTPAVQHGSNTAPSTYSLNGGTLDPGIYYGGLSLKGTITMNPGIYILAGGGLSLQSGTTTITGNGVMIFNTQNDNASCRSGAGCTAGALGSLDTSGNPTIIWRAPTSGYYQGIVIYQARVADGISATDEANHPITLQGGNSNNSLVDGLVYAVDTNLSFQGGINVAGNLIVGSMTANGNVNITGTSTTSPLMAEKAGFTQVVAWKDY